MKKLLSLIVLTLLMMTGLAWAQGSQNFEGQTGLTTNYRDGSFTENGITWTYGRSRSEGSYAIDGKGLMLHNANESYLSATTPGGIGNFSFQYRKALTGANARQLELHINGEVVATTLEFGAGSGALDTVYTLSYFVNTPGEVTIKIKNVGNATTDKHAVLDNITWTGYDPDTPWLTVSPRSINDLDYEQGCLTPTYRSFKVQAKNINAPLSITVSDNFQISSDSDFSDLIGNITQTSETEIATYFVRMEPDLELGGYHGVITATSQNTKGNVLTSEIAVSGYILPATSSSCYYVTFEGDGETKPEFASGTVTLSTIGWNMTDVLIGTLNSDFKLGARSARLNGQTTSVMTMIGDKHNGLGTLSFYYRRFGTEDQVDWRAEYSSDQGETWIQIGDDFTALASDEVQRFSKEVNVPGDVRIRILRASGVAPTNANNGRLNIDNILMTKYLGYDYNTGIPEETEIGTVTLTKGYANNSDATMPPMPNTSIGSDEYKSLSLDLVASDTWTVQIETVFDFCSYNRQDHWYDAEKSDGKFMINIPAAGKGTNDLFIVLFE